MNLHRSDQSPEWATVPASSRNIWQKLAVVTRGIVTPANFITLLGLALSSYGLWQLGEHNYWPAFWYLLVGRLLDVADGFVADKTGTKSPLGELLDASIDKFVTLLAVVAIFVADPAYRFVVLGMFTPQAFIALYSLRQHFSGLRIHPSASGKLSLAVLWVCLLGILLNLALDRQLLNAAIYGLAGLSVGLSLIALAGYISPSRTK